MEPRDDNGAVVRVHGPSLFCGFALAVLLAATLCSATAAAAPDAGPRITLALEQMARSLARMERCR